MPSLRMYRWHKPATLGGMAARCEAIRWPAIRAGLIALAIVVGLLDGCPVPSPSERPVMEARLAPELVAAIDTLDGVRQTLLRPFRAIGDTARLRQRWKLFSGANRRRFRMQIEARTGPGAAWELLYRALDDEHAFLAGPIEYRRVRGAWNPHSRTGPRVGYPAFVRWVAGEVFERRPQYTEVRVRQQRIVIGRRGGYRGTGEIAHDLGVRRAGRP